jgi:hypothetical protein
MARDYGKIFSSIWQSRKFRGIRGDDRARLLYMYLHTCPQVNSVGCFGLPLGYIVTDMGWTEAEAAECLRALQTVGLVEWDESEEMIRICGFVDHDPPTNPKHAGAMKSTIRALHDGNLKQAVIADLLRQKHCLQDAELIEMRDTLSIGYKEPLAPSLPVPVPIPNPLPHQPSGAVAPADDGDDGFDEFFQAFPKQENRKDAQEQYRIALAKAPRDAILAGAKRYFKTCSDRQPRHISPPAVWLAKERWTDGAAAPDPLAAEPDPSWGGLADRFKAEIGASNFQAYFADARVVDGDPQRIQVKSAVKKRLIDQKFPRQLRKLCGEVVIEVAA